MLIYNLDERKLYITDRDMTGELHPGYEVEPKDILMYLNDEIEFIGENLPTLRDLRNFIVGFPLLIFVQPDLQSFIDSTSNLGFINKNNKRCKLLYLLKVNRIEKSEGKLLDIKKREDNVFSDFLEYTYIKKRNVTINKHFYLFSQHPAVEVDDDILKEEFINNFNGSGLNRLDYLMDLSYKDIFDVPVYFKEYLFESYTDIEKKEVGFSLKEPEESLEYIDETTMSMFELFNLLSSVIQTEIMLPEDYDDEDIDFGVFDTPSEKFTGLKLVESKDDNIIQFPGAKNEENGD